MKIEWFSNLIEWVAISRLVSITDSTIIKHLEALNYYVYHTILNTLDYGLPHKRERMFIVGFKEDIKFEFPKPLMYRKSLVEILEKEEEVDKKFYASKDIIKKRKAKLKIQPPYPSIWHENKSGNISALEYSCALRGASYNYLLVNGIRRLTPRELLRLQGFPDDFKIIVPYTQIRKQIGNSVSVPVIESIAKEMLFSIQRKNGSL
jgi:DNA (cytosine-5)-methyltransferase 1